MTAPASAVPPSPSIPPATPTPPDGWMHIGWAIQTGYGILFSETVTDEQRTRWSPVYVGDERTPGVSGTARFAFPEDEASEETRAARLARYKEWLRRDRAQYEARLDRAIVAAAGVSEAVKPHFWCNKCGYSGPVQVGHQRPNGTGECGYMAALIPPSPPGQCKNISDCIEPKTCFGFGSAGCRRTSGVTGPDHQTKRCQSPVQLPPGYEVVADNVKASEEGGAWVCRACGFRGFWRGGPHCMWTGGAGA